MIFDGPSYCRSLPHLGTPLAVPALGLPLLKRDIPGTGYADATGPWPYASAPSLTGFEPVLEAMKAASLVSVTLFIRPDAGVAWDGPAVPGVEAVHLKEHYVLDPAIPRPAPRAKTRRNLAIAARHWRVVPVAAAELAAMALGFQASLAARRDLSAFADVPADHFAVLAGLDGIEAMAAVDDDGVGALLIAARSGGETHLLHLFTTPRVVRTCGTYLLMATALELWSRDGCVYMGGAPSSADGPGIARFKARWANRTAPVSLLKVVVNRPVYHMLSAGTGMGANGFFPAYRGPACREPAYGGPACRGRAA